MMTLTEDNCSFCEDDVKMLKNTWNLKPDLQWHREVFGEEMRCRCKKKKGQRQSCIDEYKERRQALRHHWQSQDWMLGIISAAMQSMTRWLELQEDYSWLLLFFCDWRVEWWRRESMTRNISNDKIVRGNQIIRNLKETTAEMWCWRGKKRRCRGRHDNWRCFVSRIGCYVSRDRCKNV